LDSTLHCVRRTILDLHIKKQNLRRLVIPTAHGKRTPNSLGDTTSIGNHQDAGNSSHPEGRDQPGNDAALFCDGEDSALRDQAPDITARCRVSYDSNYAFAGGKNLRWTLAD
jgi:hypothetical protein